jgi:hypothetical protein
MQVNSVAQDMVQVHAPEALARKLPLLVSRAEKEIGLFLACGGGGARSADFSQFFHFFPSQERNPKITPKNKSKKPNTPPNKPQLLFACGAIFSPAALRPFRYRYGATVT